MPSKVDDIHSALMQDPDFSPKEGQSKDDAAWAVAWSRYRQMQKNEQVLAMASSAPEEVEKAAKEPWEIPQADFTSLYQQRHKASMSREAYSRLDEGDLAAVNAEAVDYHQHTIKQALRAGKLVPREVLADYPKLVPEPKQMEKQQYGMGTHNDTPMPLKQGPPSTPFTEKEAGHKKPEHPATKDVTDERLPQQPAQGSGYSTHAELSAMEKAKSPRNPYAIATSVARQEGYKDFSEGSEGQERRDDIVEAITEKKGLGSLYEWLEKQGRQPKILAEGPHGRLLAHGGRVLYQEKHVSGAWHTRASAERDVGGDVEVLTNLIGDPKITPEAVMEAAQPKSSLRKQDCVCEHCEDENCLCPHHQDSEEDWHEEEAGDVQDDFDRILEDLQELRARIAGEEEAEGEEIEKAQRWVTPRGPKGWKFASEKLDPTKLNIKMRDFAYKGLQTRVLKRGPLYQLWYKERERPKKSVRLEKAAGTHAQPGGASGPAQQKRIFAGTIVAERDRMAKKNPNGMMTKAPRVTPSHVESLQYLAEHGKEGALAWTPSLQHERSFLDRGWAELSGPQKKLVITEEGSKVLQQHLPRLTYGPKGKYEREVPIFKPRLLKKSSYDVDPFALSILRHWNSLSPEQKKDSLAAIDKRKAHKESAARRVRAEEARSRKEAREAWGETAGVPGVERSSKLEKLREVIRKDQDFDDRYNKFQTHKLTHGKVCTTSGCEWRSEPKEVKKAREANPDIPTPKMAKLIRGNIRADMAHSVFSSTGVLTVNQVARRAGLSRKEAGKALQALVHLGKVRPTIDGFERVAKLSKQRTPDFEADAYVQRTRRIERRLRRKNPFSTRPMYERVQDELRRLENRKRKPRISKEIQKAFPTPEEHKRERAAALKRASAPTLHAPFREPWEMSATEWSNNPPPKIRLLGGVATYDPKKGSYKLGDGEEAASHVSLADVHRMLVLRAKEEGKPVPDWVYELRKQGGPPGPPPRPGLGWNSLTQRWINPRRGYQKAPPNPLLSPVKEVLAKKPEATEDEVISMLPVGEIASQMQAPEEKVQGAARQAYRQVRGSSSVQEGEMKTNIFEKAFYKAFGVSVKVPKPKVHPKVSEMAELLEDSIDYEAEMVGKKLMASKIFPTLSHRERRQVTSAMKHLKEGNPGRAYRAIQRFSPNVIPGAYKTR